MTAGLLLSFMSVCVFIFFIHHIARSIQVAFVVAQVGKEFKMTLNRLFPCPVSGAIPEDELLRIAKTKKPDFEKEGCLVLSVKSGYVQSINEKQLMDFAVKKDCVLELVCRVGSYRTERDPLLKAWPQTYVTDKDRKKLAKLFTLGTHRTPTQDLEFSLVQLSDIAVRALSPGINDPHTAINCIDEISNCLALVCTQHIPPGQREQDGKLRLIMPDQVFSDLVEASFGLIRRSAAGHVSVILKLLDAIQNVLLHSPLKSQRQCLQLQAWQVIQNARLQKIESRDMDRIEGEYANLHVHESVGPVSFNETHINQA